MNLKKVNYGVVTINESLIPESEPVFAVKDDKLAGMIMKEPLGWILRFPPHFGCSGYHETRVACMRSAESLGYEFMANAPKSQSEG